MPIESVEFRFTIIQGKGLVAKDRNILGRKTSSDPYIKLYLSPGDKIKLGSFSYFGHTTYIPKTLNPIWNETIVAIPHRRPISSRYVASLAIFDFDSFSSDDPMGGVYMNLDATGDSVMTQWYDVEKLSTCSDQRNNSSIIELKCKNATGKIQVKVETFVTTTIELSRGNALSVSGLTSNNKIKVGLAWDMLGHKSVDLDVSCVAISNQGQISMENTVYYGNPSNPNESVCHSGDEQEGDAIGDDEWIVMDLNNVPNDILAFYIILTVATPGMKLGEIKSTKFRVSDYMSDNNICTYHPVAGNNGNTKLSENATAMFMVRIGRMTLYSKEWIIRPIEDTHPTARDFGGLIPHIKSYTKDLLPTITIDPSERVALLRKNGNIRLTDYYSGGKLPDSVTLGLAWDITCGKAIDLDASAICLDANLNLIDKVWFQQLKSKDGSIIHHGDERRGDAVGDDEKMDIYLNKVKHCIKYIGFVINSYSGEELDDVDRASCHIYDSETRIDIASYALTNSAQLDKHTALVLGCLYRNSKNNGDDDWCLCVISEAAQGRTVKDNVDELQNYLRRHPPKAPSSPQPVVDEEIAVSSIPEFVPYETPAVAATPSSTASTPTPAGVGGKAPKKFVNINGITKLNPEWKKWKALQGK